MLIFILLLSFLTQLSYTYVAIRTFHGTLKGVPSLVSPRITEFLGVPYAEPPLGPLRFKKPKPLPCDYYGEGLIVNRYAKACIQLPRKYKFKGYKSWYPEKYKMSEDCLQLNMWVPKKPNGAVIVFLFGGEYTHGSASIDYYNGNFLAAKTGVIVITLNYRLGVFGFAYYRPYDLGGIPGNLGLLDQQLGLRWIRDNIGFFGGDPKKVTLFGQGSGGAMATAHLYAPGSSHLFRRIIASSGTIHHKWATSRASFVRHNFENLIKSVKCDGGFYIDHIKCMQNVTASELALKASLISHPEQQYLSEAPFIPVDKDDIFFYGNLTTFYRKRGFVKWKIDLLIGKTEDEASLFMGLKLGNSTSNCSLNFNVSMESIENQCNMTKQDYNFVVQLIAHNEHLTNLSFPTIKQVYKNKKSFREKALRALSDFDYNCDSNDFAKIINEENMGSVFYYNFKNRSLSNPWPKWMGAMHGYDMLYIFGYPFYNPEYYNKTKDLKTEKEISLKIMNVISGFAMYGNITREVDNFNLSNCGNEPCKNKFEFGKYNSTNFDKNGTCSDVEFIRQKYRYQDPLF